MSLITIVVSLIVVGVLLWLVNTYIPMDGKIKQILNAVVVVVVVLWLLNVFGVLDHLRNIRTSNNTPSLGLTIRNGHEVWGEYPMDASWCSCYQESRQTSGPSLPCGNVTMKGTLI